jgi:predicted small lipoprotein YifL
VRPAWPGRPSLAINVASAIVPPESEWVPVPKSSLSVVRVVAVSAAILLSLSACGRKGPLEPPPGAVDAKPDLLSQQNESETPGVKTLVPSISPVGSGRKGKPITAPKDTFFLDPIL